MQNPNLQQQQQQRPRVSGVASYGSETQVADFSPINHLAFYLKCVWGCGVLSGFDVDPNLIDYNNAHRLSGQQQRIIVETVMHTLNPESLLNRVYFVDDQHTLLPSTASNAFFAIETSHQHPAVAAGLLGPNALQQLIHKIMLCTSEWLEKYYFKPIYSLQSQASASINSTLFGLPPETTIHCSHCRGGEDYCTCECGCPTSGISQCRVLHRGIECFACKTEIQGQRYTCSSCGPTIQMCEGCYEDGAHDSTHPVHCIDRVGSTPRLIPPMVTLLQHHHGLAAAAAAASPSSDDDDDDDQQQQQQEIPTAEVVPICKPCCDDEDEEQSSEGSANSSSSSSPSLARLMIAGQVVRLVGLATEGMNDREALVLSVLDTDRVQVRLLGGSPTATAACEQQQQPQIYSVRPENLVQIETTMASLAIPSCGVMELD